MSKRILIVEDEEDNLTLLVHILKFVLAQDQIIIARSGREAILKAYEHRPDIVLMDLTIPQLDGLETTRSLKNDQRFNKVPILAITAHAMVGDRERALQAGCDNYFTKPIDIDRFVRFMQPYLIEKVKSKTESKENEKS